MLLKQFTRLPKNMQNDTVKKYYNLLAGKRAYLFFKRIMDIIISGTMLVVLAAPYLAIALYIVIDSGFPIIYKQERIKRYGQSFFIYKFRTMKNGDNEFLPITINNDERITKSGRFLRKYRLDELPQMFNILKGDMSLVGPRPEVPLYVKLYTDEMLATLLVPVGLTCEASLRFKNEGELLNKANFEKEYITNILPHKMLINLNYILHISFVEDVRIVIKTIINLLI